MNGPASGGERQREVAIIEARAPGWVVLWGRHSRRFWAFGAADGVPVSAPTASEVLGAMLASDRAAYGPYGRGAPRERADGRLT